VKIDENFRGKTLSSWMAEWVQWVHSGSVSYTSRFGEILFIRGNLSYDYKYPGGPRIQTDADRPYEEEVFISNNVPVYVNIRTAFYFISEPHPFTTLNTLTDVISACRDDHSHGGTREKHITELINPANINDTVNQQTELNSVDHIEAFGINIKVDPNSQLADQFEFPVQRGADLIGCAVGEICLIKSLPDGDYFIETSNTGARGYKSGSKYVIHVGPDRAMSPF